MSRSHAAMIQDGVVTNVIVVDTETLPTLRTTLSQFELVDIGMGSRITTGWSYLNGEFTPPTQPEVEDELDPDPEDDEE